MTLRIIFTNATLRIRYLRTGGHLITNKPKMNDFYNPLIYNGLDADIPILTNFYNYEIQLSLCRDFAIWAQLSRDYAVKTKRLRCKRLTITS